MRYLPLLLLFPLLSAQAAPDCTRLKTIAQNLEDVLNRKKIEKCSELTAKDIGQPDGAPGLSGPEDLRCLDFGALDLRLKAIENEIALFKGITKLQEEIQQGLATFKKFPDQKIALNSSKSFYQNLKVAASLEDFMNTNNDKGENILSKVVADKAGWTDINSFAGLLRKHCDDFSRENTVCKQGYAFSPETFAEIEAFVKVGGKSTGKFDKKQIKELKNALELKKGKEAYSYNLLLLEIKDPGEGVISEADLEKIKALPELEHGSKDFNFLKEIKVSSKNLKQSKELLYAQGVPDRIRSLATDLRNREQWELKSKLAYLLTQHEVPEALKAECDKVRELADDVGSKCLDSLAKSKTGDEKSKLEDYSKEFKYGQKHIAELDRVLQVCVPNENLELSESCLKSMGNINQKMEELTKKASVLQALKVKQLQGNAELVDFRNFALQKLMSGECMTEGDAEIKECYQDIGTISREAVTLTGSAGEILYVLEKPNAEIAIDKLCDEGVEKVFGKDELCELADEEAKKNSGKTKVVDDLYNAPVDPNHRDTSKEGLVNAGLSLLNSVGSIFMPKPQPMINPYANNMNPYPMVARPMDISSKIMSPYIASGYGNYFPTPGLRTYSSINSNVGTYSAYDMGGSKFFNSPVGW